MKDSTPTPRHTDRSLFSNREKPSGGIRNAPGRERPSFKGNGPRRGGPRPAGNRADRDRQPEKATPARYSALIALSDVLDKGAYVSEAVNRQLSQSTFPANDRRFCTALVYGTLENLTAIDHILDAFIEDTDKLDIKVRHILRLSVCQKAFMDKIPDNAIADEAVKLTRQMNLEYLTGFVNGVLRNYFREPEKVIWPDEAGNQTAYLAVRYSMPEWVVAELTGYYGPDLAKAVITYRPAVHDITIRPNLMRYPDDARFEELLNRKVWQSRKGTVPHAYHVSGVMQIARDTDYMEGAFSIQGEASMLCAQLAQVKPGMTVLDACAAPGGKTALMAEMMQGAGRVYAWDLHEHRAALLNAMKSRLKLDNIRAAAHDAQILKEDFVQRMDVCLVDAPCSGLGVINDKPDIKYGVTPEAVAEMTEIQRNLLNTCCQYVKRNGALIYSTCSILPDENERMCEWFLKEHPDYTLEPVPAWVCDLFPRARKEQGLQLLPGVDGDEGFFIARFRRNGTVQ